MKSLIELFEKKEDKELRRFLTNAYLDDISTIDFVNVFKKELSFSEKNINAVKATLREFILTHKEELIKFGQKRLARFEGNFKEMVDEPSGGRSTRFAWTVPTELI